PISAFRSRSRAHGWSSSPGSWANFRCFRSTTRTSSRCSQIRTREGTEMSAHPHGNLDNPDTDHEHSDINVRAIIWFGVVLTVIVLAVDVAMYGLFKLL